MSLIKRELKLKDKYGKCKAYQNCKDKMIFGKFVCENCVFRDYVEPNKKKLKNE